jgi:galactofuranosylgalactofuranosylrhamnosyl-N-acetylglucosaminyl-diphospho-decaprenol beta-1,5/1,6-galactofuranosyltransferase
MSLNGHLISRIRLPLSVDGEKLYVRLSEGARLTARDTILFSSGSEASFDSYFNSIYEQCLLPKTEIKSLFYQLELEGSFKVKIFRRTSKGESTVLSETLHHECQASTPIQLEIPLNPETPDASRVFLTLAALTDQGRFLAGSVLTREKPRRDVNLAVVTCTFKREKYIRRTLEVISNDPWLREKKIKIFVVDNARTLDAADFSDPMIELIPNRNLGSSGGFTRGMMEAYQGGFSHTLLMDDDIDLESESILRVITFYEYAKNECALSGSMLDILKRYSLYEMGGRVSGKGYFSGNGPPACLTALRRGADLSKVTALDEMNVPLACDYGAWWFFAFPTRCLQTTGFAMPFFIKIDDVDFSFRLAKAGVPIFTYPSIAVWHEPFYAKSLIWDSYFFYRNFLIFYSLDHAPHEPGLYPVLILHFTKKMIANVLSFDYNSAALMVRALKDYFRGPEFLMSLDFEKHHQEIVVESKASPYQTVITEDWVQPPTSKSQSFGLLTALSALVTLNGHFGPVIGSRGPSYAHHGMPLSFKQRFSELGCAEHIRIAHGARQVSRNRAHSATGRKLVVQWFWTILSGAFRVRSVRKRWKNALTEMTGYAFWKQVLEKGGGQT